jgi:hypothetical protein
MAKVYLHREYVLQKVALAHAGTMQAELGQQEQAFGGTVKSERYE